MRNLRATTVVKIKTRIAKIAISTAKNTNKIAVLPGRLVKIICKTLKKIKIGIILINDSMI